MVSGSFCVVKSSNRTTTNLFYWKGCCYTSLKIVSKYLRHSQEIFSLAKVGSKMSSSLWLGGSIWRSGKNSRKPLISHWFKVNEIALQCTSISLKDTSNSEHLVSNQVHKQYIFLNISLHWLIIRYSWEITKI